MSLPPTSDDAPTYDPSAGLSERLRRLADLIDVEQAPALALVTMGVDGAARAHLHVPDAIRAHDLLMALLVGVEEYEADTLLDEVSELSEAREDP